MLNSSSHIHIHTLLLTSLLQHFVQNNKLSYCIKIEFRLKQVAQSDTDEHRPLLTPLEGVHT